MRINMIAIVGAIGILAAWSVEAEDAEIEKGEEIYLGRCEYCHGEGPHRSATSTLGRRYKDTEIAAVLSERTDLTPDVIRAFVRNATPSMAPVRKTEISDEELEWLIAYLTRNNPES